MAVEIQVPELGESVTEATVGKWLKSEGDAVEAGEPLVELETDKINFEVEAEQDGVLESIAKGEGEDVGVGEVIGTIGEGSANRGDGAAAQETEEDEAEQEEGQEEESQEEESQEEQPAAEAGGEETNGHREDSGVRASPSVRKLAGEYDVDLAEVSGSGAGGRVTKDDVERLIRVQSRGDSAQEESPERDGQKEEAPSQAAQNGRGDLEERIRLSRRRQTIAARLVEAQQTAAMLTTFNEVDMTAVMDLRARRKEAFQKQYGVGLGIASFFVKASIGALRAFPRINAEIQGDEMVLKHYYDIGVAVGASEGLVVPVLRDADQMSFANIEQQIRDFARRAEDGSLSLADLKGGTFTITNGGVFGSLLSTPILNPPQVGILGLHAIQQRPVAQNGQVVIKPMMYVALTYDHRIVDGSEAVQFLVRVKQLVEDPAALLLD